MPVFQANTAISHACMLVCADAAQRDRETTELAAAMLCTSQGTRPCRVCRDCRKVFRGVHPDVLFTDPVGSAKTAAIKAANEKLTAAWNKVSEQLYKAAQQQQQAAGQQAGAQGQQQSANTGANTSKDDGVIDAEIVDDDKK